MATVNRSIVLSSLSVESSLSAGTNNIINTTSTQYAVIYILTMTLSSSAGSAPYLELRSADNSTQFKKIDGLSSGAQSTNYYDQGAGIVVPPNVKVNVVVPGGVSCATYIKATVFTQS